MLLSITAGKAVVKTQLGFQSKHYRHCQIHLQRETTKQPKFQQMILTPSQDTPLSGTDSARLSLGFGPNPSTKRSPHNCWFTKLPPASVMAAGEPGEKERRRATWWVPQLGSPKICSLKPRVSNYFFFLDWQLPCHGTYPGRCRDVLTQPRASFEPLAQGPAVGAWELLFLARETELQTRAFSTFASSGHLGRNDAFLQVLFCSDEQLNSCTLLSAPCPVITPFSFLGSHNITQHPELYRGTNSLLSPLKIPPLRMSITVSAFSWPCRTAGS